MKRFIKDNYKKMLILASIFVIYLITITILGYDYGSMVDWVSQHYRIPEYFRNLFYQTGKLFPNFAFNLGAGQNIYYFSYHGLFNPLILLSYLLPFIKMSNYIVAIYILLVLVSTYLLYYWLSTKYDSRISFIVSLIFLLSGPLVYQTHRHLMFINYMPFLILGLMGVDKYFNNSKKTLLMISIVLIIFSSYYYSVGSLIVLFIYGICLYLNKHHSLILTDVVHEGLKYIFIFIVPIMVSGILLLPTISTLISGRNSTSVDINLLNTLIPKFSISVLLYYSYGVGLSAFSLYSIIDNIVKKKYRLISIVILTILFIPFFIYLLNGFMYYDGKALIPFLPLLCLLIGNSLNHFSKKTSIKISLVAFIILSIIVICGNLYNSYLVIYIIDSFLVIISLIYFEIRKSYKPLLASIILIMIVNFGSLNLPKKFLNGISPLFSKRAESYVNYNYLNEIDNYNEKDLINIIDNDFDLVRSTNLNNILPNVNNVLSNDYYGTSIYSSTSNRYYTDFVRNVFKNEIYNKDYATITNSSNLLFNIYMGNKYLLSDNSLLGYNLVKEGKYTNLYMNNDVFSIGYASNDKMSLREFNSLTYPYTMDALLRYVIVEEDIDNVYVNNIKELSNIAITKEFDVLDTKELSIKLDNSIKDSILIITFDNLYNESCSIGNQSITINGVVNTLSCKTWKYHNNNNTFHYVISSNDIIDTINISLSKGHYSLDNLHIYQMSYNDIINYQHDNLIIDKNNSSDDKIIGNIEVKEDDSTFVLNIPYDKGFSISVDGKKIDYKLTNKSFIGFNLSKGTHTIIINYYPPLKELGIIISILGVIILIVVISKEKGGINGKNKKIHK